jgi:signal peptidase I
VEGTAGTLARRRALRGLRLLRDASLGLLALLAIASAAGAALTVRVYGTSMEPTLPDGTLLLVDRVSLRLGWPNRLQRGEVVEITQPNGVSAVKRLVGLPGDRIEIKNTAPPTALFGRPEILIQPGGHGPWRRLVEPYVRFRWDRAERCCDALGRDLSGPAQPFTVPPGEYWVLGDNRNISLDSRAFGVIPYRRLQGIVLASYWPPAQARWLDQQPKLGPP